MTDKNKPKPPQTADAILGAVLSENAEQFNLKDSFRGMLDPDKNGVVDKRELRNYISSQADTASAHMPVMSREAIIRGQFGNDEYTQSLVKMARDLGLKLDAALIPKVIDELSSGATPSTPSSQTLKR